MSNKLRKVVYYARAWAALPFVALAWLGFGIAMLIEPKGPKP